MGIYDVSGGAWEFTMGVLNKLSGDTNGRNSGYAGTLTDGSSIEGREWPDSKYYDVYTSDNVETSCNGKPCKGHALNETMKWYKNAFDMVNVNFPWSCRSGEQNYGQISGVFFYSAPKGNAATNGSFRQVLIPQNTITTMH